MAVGTPLYRQWGEDEFEDTGLTLEYVERLEKALAEIARLQGEIIPVYNDEFVRMSWIRDIVDDLIRSNLT